MKVVIGTHGRFHSFDLARELARHGVFGGIWTRYPASKVSDEGLPAGTTHCVSAMTYLRHGLDKIVKTPTWFDERLERVRSEAIDRAIRLGMPKDADTLVALSGSGLGAGRALRARGGVYVCDRGSTHIRFAEETLREEYARYGLPAPRFYPPMVAKEEAEYAEADGILVPTSYVARTFIDRGIPAEKMKKAPYGVNLGQFYPDGTPPEGTFEVLFVGGLSIRKGIRYLLEAFERFSHPNKRLTLVGAPADETKDLVAKAVASGRVALTGIVSRDEVRRHMSRSHAMVLPSVEEGLALVQAQALACGCPVIACPPTGCEDLYEDGEQGFIVPARDSAALADALARLADEPELRARMSASGIERVKALGGWDRYGDTVVGHLRDLHAARAHA